MITHSSRCLFRWVTSRGLETDISHQIQENYLKTQPAKTRDLNGASKTLKHLQLMDKAASSISDADLVDALIHGCVSCMFYVYIWLTILSVLRLDRSSIGL